MCETNTIVHFMQCNAKFENFTFQYLLCSDNESSKNLVFSQQMSKGDNKQQGWWMKGHSVFQQKKDCFLIWRQKKQKNPIKNTYGNI